MGATLGGGAKGANFVSSGNFAVGAGLIPTATESLAVRTTQAAGTISQLGASVNNLSTGRSITLRKNTANANSTVSFADTTTQIVYDTTHTDAVIATDTIDLIVNGTGNYTPYFIKYVFSATTGTVSYPWSVDAVAASTSPIFTTFGSCWTTTEANAQQLMRSAGTISNVAVNVTTAGTGTATVVSRIAGASGTVSISVTATTGVFVDNTHTDAFTAGQLVGFQCTGQSTGLLAFVSAVITWTTTSNDVFGGTTSGLGTVLSFSASDQFVPILGAPLVTSTTEAFYKIQHGFSGTCTRIRWFVISNTMTGTSTVTLRKNGVDATNTFTIGTTATGQFEDTTPHTDTFADTDDFCYRFSGGTSGLLRYGPIAITEAVTAVPVFFGDTDNAASELVIVGNKPVMVPYH